MYKEDTIQKTLKYIEECKAIIKETAKAAKGDFTVKIPLDRVEIRREGPQYFYRGRSFTQDQILRELKADATERNMKSLSRKKRVIINDRFNKIKISKREVNQHECCYTFQNENYFNTSALAEAVICSFL